MKKNLLSQNSCSVISAEDSSNVLKKFLSAEQTNSLWIIFSQQYQLTILASQTNLLKGHSHEKSFLRLSL
jgi:hypothetical protein